MDVRGQSKLGPRLYGPFKVLERIGDVAYFLQLPVSARLYNVRLLKPSATGNKIPQLLAINHGRACAEPQNVIKACLARGGQEVLVHWKGQEASHWVRV